METQTEKLRPVDFLLLNKLNQFESVGCPTPKLKWFADLFDVSTITMRKHFRNLKDTGCIVEANKFDYVLTDKGRELLKNNQQLTLKTF